MPIMPQWDHYDASAGYTNLLQVTEQIYYCPNAGDEDADRDQKAPFFDHLVDEVQSGATWPKIVGEKNVTKILKCETPNYRSKYDAHIDIIPGNISMDSTKLSQTPATLQQLQPKFLGPPFLNLRYEA